MRAENNISEIFDEKYLIFPSFEKQEPMKTLLDDEWIQKNISISDYNAQLLDRLLSRSPSLTMPSISY